jgi:DNA gyrase subunit A
VSEVRLTGRNTMGVQFAKAGKGDAIVGVARNPERDLEEAVEAIEAAQEEAGLIEPVGNDEVTATAGENDDVVSTGDQPARPVAAEATDAVPSVDTEDDAGGRE